MPKNQTRYIFEFLTEMKDQGIIRTVSEYNEQLKLLTAELKKDEPRPMFKLFMAIIGNIIDSDRFNAMVKSVRADMEVAFQEAAEVANVLELHKSLYKLVVLKALRTGVKNLERKISLYEFLNRSEDGFTTGQFESFDEAGNSTQRTDPLSGQLYYDSRRKLTVSDSNDAVIDLVGEELILPSHRGGEVNVTEIELVEDATTIASTRNIQYSDSSMANVIDGTLHTYWYYPVLLDDSVAAGIKTKLRLNLGEAAREINILRIEPANSYAMVLETLSYVASDGTVKDITMDTTIEAGKEVNLHFTSIITSEVTLTFRQDHYELVSYYYQPSNDLWDQVHTSGSLDAEDIDSGRLDRIGEELQDILEDKALRDMCGVPERPGWELVQGIQYTFGFDNIRFYDSRYKDTGIFVSKKLSVARPGLIAFKATEVNPTVDIAGTDYNVFSFEYTLLKRNFDIDGRFLGSENIPIAPLEDNNVVTDERLWLTDTSVASAVKDVARLRFVPDTTTTPVIYENLFSALAIGTDYEVKVGTNSYQTTWTDVQTDIDADYATQIPLTIYIKFLNPSVISYYTANYSLRIDYQMLDFVKLQRSGILSCDLTRGENTPVENSDIYLTIIMRRNYVADDRTCRLSDYKLLVASQESDKFV